MLYDWESLSREEEDSILEGVKQGRALAGPFHLALFPTDRCNYDCFFCYTETLRREAAELAWPALRGALEDAAAAGLRGVSFGGGGEPLLYRELGALLEFLEERGLTVDSVKTNGTRLRPDVAGALARLRFRRLTISLNETRAGEFARMNRCSPRLFERVREGARNLIEARDRAGIRAEISIQIFVWKENFRRLLEMIETLLPWGADAIYVAAIEGLPAAQRLDAAEREEFQALLSEAVRRWVKVLQFNLSAEGLQDFVNAEQYRAWPPSIQLPEMTGAPERIEYCYMGWHAAVVTADGGVYPCCHFTTDPRRALGNLNAARLREIWRGEAARRYRAEMRHLLLTGADRSRLPADARFIHPLCLERAACAFNFYLASPRAYFALHEWAESGARERYREALERGETPWKAGDSHA